MPPLGGIIFAFLLVVIQSAFCRSAIYILACILFTVVSPHCYFAQYPSLFAINFVVQD
jgi:hypothetical protein